MEYGILDAVYENYCVHRMMRIGANRLAWEFGGRVFMGSEVGVGSGSCHLHEEKRNTYSTAGGTN